jgi:hypothetical protein
LVYRCFSYELNIECIDIDGNNFAGKKYEFFLLEGIFGGGEAAVFEESFFSE